VDRSNRSCDDQMAKTTDDMTTKLQHPRRSLGNRHRSQAEKFLSLTESDMQNLKWAEQSARQAVLHDFTNPENWRILVKVKLESGDEDGIRAVLNELFTILGRDPETLAQLDEVSMNKSGSLILEASLMADPLDPDEWWASTSQSDVNLGDFIERVKNLDLTDQRANVLFSRRLERVRDNGMEEQYLELSRIILAQRPSNHEAWAELGRMHERRGEFEQAWMCYDQAQTHFPDIHVRDRFRDRMEAKMDGRASKPWKEPEVSRRVDFFTRMQQLATPNVENIPTTVNESNEVSSNPLEEVHLLLAEERLSEAFFLARRMAAEGVEGAIDLVESIRKDIHD
jgi:tetratricopeptide (TPR) repeat protein